MLNLTEQEDLLLESYRGMDNQSRTDLWQEIVQIEEREEMRKQLSKLASALDVLQELVKQWREGKKG